MLNAATALNLHRKSAWADHVQLREGVPLPSWIDVNTGELCNRSFGHPKACVFCPRIDPALVPNQKLFLSLGLARKIADELLDWDYKGAVVFSGYGEALYHPEIVDLVAQFGRGLRLHLELVTNGDRLSAPLIDALYSAGLSFIAVSCYDGPEQIDKFTAMFRKAGATEASYGLRDRWHDEDDSWGLKLTNRAGVMETGPQPRATPRSPCNYPSYSAMLDWDGRVLLCVQDWHRKVTFGNLHDQSLWDIWTSTAMRKRRLQLLRGREGLSPCSGCNACGTLHGSGHAEAWKTPAAAAA